MVAPSIASIFTSSSAHNGDKTAAHTLTKADVGSSSSVFEQIKMLERLSIHQLRLNRELKEEEEKLRLRLAKMKGEK
ncbi:hypothetical protein EON65_47135 [archaeon]|nr:MAG: hypothetical protein EON65_47135 [archaeon]